MPRPHNRPVASGNTANEPLRSGTFAALAILLLTLVLSFIWSHAKLLGNDEFLSFYSDSVPTLGDVLHVQLHTPISLDPPTYHLLSHLSMGALGHNATALRLPALLGFLLMQASLFVLVRRLAGPRAALIAMVLPLCTASFRYAVEGRPYALLLGLYAASLTCWYTATQQVDSGAPPSPRLLRPRWVRTLYLFGLFLSLSLAITSHYFGVLILLPVVVGEAVRTQGRKKIDWVMLAVIAAGTASIALILPFKAALAHYQHHYYTSTVNIRNVSQGYRELFIHYNDWPMPLQRITAILLIITAFVLLWANVRRYRTRPASEPSYLWAALLTLAVLPVCGYLFGKFVTHTMEVRYVVAALIFFVVAIALAIAPALRSRFSFACVMTTLLVCGIAFTIVQIHNEANASNRLLSQLQLPTPIAIPASREPIYIQTLSDFFLRTYYTADPGLRDRYALLYDADRELRWLHHDTNAVTADYLRQFTPLRTARFADAAATQSALALVAEPGGWNWLLPELAHTNGLTAAPLGTMGTMQLVRITWTAPAHDGNTHAERN